MFAVLAIGEASVFVTLLIATVISIIRYNRLRVRIRKLATWAEPLDAGLAARVRLLTSEHVLDYDWLP